jgi:hypothetical protein
MNYAEGVLYRAWLGRQFDDAYGPGVHDLPEDEYERRFHAWRVEQVDAGRDLVAEWRGRLHA